MSQKRSKKNKRTYNWKISSCKQQNHQFVYSFSLYLTQIYILKGLYAHFYKENIAFTYVFSYVKEIVRKNEIVLNDLFSDTWI